MATTRKTIKVTGENTLAELLPLADDAPVLLETNGARYRLSRDEAVDDIWAGYEPDATAVNEMLDEVAGRWSDLDIDQMIAKVYERRDREAGGEEPVLRLSRMFTPTDIWAGSEPDAEHVRAVLEATIGSWSDVEAEEMIKDIYRAREEGSRPPERP